MSYNTLPPMWLDIGRGVTRLLSGGKFRQMLRDQNKPYRHSVSARHAMGSRRVEMLTIAGMDKITLGPLHRRDFRSHPNNNPGPEPGGTHRAARPATTSLVDDAARELAEINRVDNLSRPGHAKLPTSIKKLRRQVRRTKRAIRDAALGA